MPSDSTSGYAQPNGSISAGLQGKLSHKRKSEITFIFDVDLVEYLKLQSTNSEQNQTISNDIRLISAGSDDNVLALPASTYVKDVWGENGTKILRGIERASMTENIGRRIRLQAYDCRIEFTVHYDGILKTNNNMEVKIKEATVKDANTDANDRPRPAQQKKLTAQVVEQIYWMVAVAGKTALAHLQKYVHDGRQLGFAGVVHIGRPHLSSCKPESKSDFKVSIPVARTEDAVKERGQCWKVMVGLALIVDNYAESRRPSGVMGLEATLPVIKRLLCKVKSSAGCELYLEGPRAERKADSMTWTKPFWRTWTSKRDVVAWHFPLEQDQDSIGEPVLNIEEQGSAQKLPFAQTSRHFVGWSRDGELNTAHVGVNIARKDLRLYRKPARFQLIFGNSLTARFPGQVLSMGISLSVERKYASLSPPLDLTMRHQYFQNLPKYQFILWDVSHKRGWMLDGLAMALYMLLEQLNRIPEAKHFDAAKQLKGLGSSQNLSVAHDVLRDPGNLNLLVWTYEDLDDIPSDKEDGSAKQKLKPKRIGHLVEAIFKQLWHAVRERNKLDDLRGGNLAPFLDWYQSTRLGTEMMGWDYEQFESELPGPPRTIKFGGRPKWLRLAKALNAIIIYGTIEQEVLRPRIGSCCSHFTGLPPGHNLLAVGISTLGSLINNYELDISPDDDYACRLEYEVGWSSPVKPFGPRCDPNHGLSTLGDHCFPIQEVMKITDEESILVRGKGAKSKYKTLVTRREFREMEAAHKNGVVVFGNRPEAKSLTQELKTMAEDLKKMQKNQAKETANGFPTVAVSSTSRVSTSAANLVPAHTPRPSTSSNSSGRSHNSPVPAFGSPSATSRPQIPGRGDFSQSQFNNSGPKAPASNSQSAADYSESSRISQTPTNASPLTTASSSPRRTGSRGASIEMARLPKAQPIPSTLSTPTNASPGRQLPATTPR